MKAPRTVTCIIFKPSEASPGESLYVHVPKLNKNKVLVPNSLALIFDIDLSGGHANNFLVKNVSRALVDKLVVKFVGKTLDETVGHDIYKTFQDLFLLGEKRDGSNYRINLDHQILTDHGVFYPQAFYDNLVFKVTLASESQVVKGSDATKLKYKLNNIRLEYQMIRSRKLADEASGIYESGKEFAYDHMMRDKVVPISRVNDERINIIVSAQRRSMKGLLLLFVEPYAAGTRDSEKYVFPDLKKISVTINGSPNMLYDSGIESRDIWSEVSRFFLKEYHKPQFMTLQKFYTDSKFGLLIDLRSMSSQETVNSTDGIQLEIERDRKGTGTINCHVYIISDAQLNVQNKQLVDVMY